MDIFPKGLSHGFCPKMVIFSTSFLGNIGQNNIFYDILEQKNAFQGYKNKVFKKSKNGHFSKGIKPWFLPKNGHIFNFFFQAIQARIMSFTIFQNEKTPFKAVKTISLKSIKIDIFSKGVNPWFFSKNENISQFFFLGNMGQDNVLYAILERKNAMVFVQKWAYFELFFQAIQARIISFTIFQNKKTPFKAIKTKCSKS